MLLVPERSSPRLAESPTADAVGARDADRVEQSADTIALIV
jgi:hypothetical protein